MRPRIFFTLFFLLINTALWAQVKFSTAYYHNSSGQQLLSPNIDQLTFTPFKSDKQLPPLANSGTYWFKVTINQPIPAEGLIIELWNPHLDTVAFYTLQAGAIRLAGYAGNSFYHSGNLTSPPSFTFRGPDKVFYVKTRFNKNVNFGLHVYTLPQHVKIILYLFFQIGLYHGVVIIVLLINVFLFFVFKDKRFLFYNGFLVFLVLSFLYSNNHLAVFTQSPFILNNADLMLHLGLVLSGSLFATAFLEIDGVYTWVKWLNGVLVPVIILAFCINAAHPNFYVFLTGELAVFASLGMFWVISLLRIRQHPFAIYFAVAYGVLLFCMINCYVLHLFNIYAFDLIYGQIEIANLIEMFTLSAALAFRVERLRRENHFYRGEIDRYMHLELDVRNQTAERTEQIFVSVQAKYGLTERETEVLRGITQGLTNPEIGEQLFLSVNTIKFHTRNIFEKMEISNRAQAVSRLHEAQ